MGIAYIRISVIYFVAGVLLGMYMSMGHAHELESVHAHVNLLGWASFALAGLIYVLFPEAGESLLSKIQFWTYSLGLPIMMISLAFWSWARSNLSLWWRSAECWLCSASFCSPPMYCCMCIPRRPAASSDAAGLLWG